MTAFLPPHRCAMAPGVSVLAAGLILACGARSGLTEDDTGDGTGVMSVDPREGGCDNPIVLPLANMEVRGRLQGPSRVEGFCGDGVIDGGAEDTYLIVPTFDTDVLLLMQPSTEFTPTLRVTRDGCYEDDNNIPRLCAAPVGDVLFRHFFAEAGHEYSVTVDSPEGTDGYYAMQIVYTAPTLDGCPVHMTQIDQELNGNFRWSNTLGGRAGQVDGRCGGPGAENMFQVNVASPGEILFRVTADTSFAPALSIRTGCGGSSELVCTSMQETGSPTLEILQFFEPGTYFVVVDQNDIRGGEYVLEVQFF
ncbi:hypothetical protein [Nannocystis pusilla]|uniref:Peptidase C-terminal archaeal/bacterial domain-containing protein n=1 Tax=Nannocystis pusilla TaxID=889268 RepID=A0ABS7TNP6_9BACT|nr:hypothetical protein [Nannocystis pusilla]MBZ5709845.1 hypothetical protein [Nannocystis pusilla]